MSRFRPTNGPSSAVLPAPRESFPITPTLNTGGQPRPVRAAWAGNSRLKLPPATSTEKVAFALNMLFLFLVSSRLVELLPSMHLIAIIVPLAAVLAILNGRLWKTLTSSFGLVFIALTAWFAVAVGLSRWRGGSAEAFEDWLKAVSVFFIVASVTVNSGQAIKAMRVSAYAYLASGVVALTTGVVYEGRLGLSSSGTLANSNYLAAAMCTGLLLWWFIVHDPKSGRISRILGVGALAAFVVIIIKAGSRGAILALLVTIPFLISHYSLLSRLRIAAGVAALGILGFMFAPGLVVERFTLLFEPDKEPESRMELRVRDATVGSNETRLDVLKRSLEITLQHPLFGVGIGMFPVVENDLAAEQSRPGHWTGTHNTYTQLSSETGIPGLCLYLVILTMSWRAMRKLRKDPRLAFHPNGLEIRAAATSLWLLLLNTMTYFFFAHLAYTATIPILSGLIFALNYSASREVVQFTSPMGAGGLAAPAQSPAGLKSRVALAQAAPGSQ